MQLNDIVKKPEEAPPFIFITGEQGTGKTTLSSYFYKPIFLRTEDGTQSLTGRDDILQTPVATKAESMREVVRMLLEQEHDFKTLVIDSITEADKLFTQEIINKEKENSKNPKSSKITSLAQAAGGYGAGYGALRESHEQFVSSLLELRDKRKMTIVLIGHVETERCSPPDSEEYMRYTPQLTKTNNVDTSKVYTNKVDLCAFISYGAFVEKRRVNSDGLHWLHVKPDLAHVSKNRYGIKDRIQFNLGENPLINLIPYLKKQHEQHELESNKLESNKLEVTK